MLSCSPKDNSAGAAGVDAVDESRKDKADIPRFPYRFLFVPVRDPDLTPLDLKEEYHRIHAVMSTTDVNSMHTATLSSTWREVVREVHTRYPLILHFACHSDKKALKFFRQELVPETIVETLRSHNEEAKNLGKDQVQIVVFNACFSNGHAEKLKTVVDFAIGHKGELPDEDAIDFAHSFYSFLFRGRSLWNCLQLAKTHEGGYELHSNRDAEAFRLTMPQKRATEIITQEQDTAMVLFFKDNGLTDIARPLCEELRIANWKFEYLKHLTEESLDVLTKTKMYPHEKKLFWDLVSQKLKELSIRTAQLCSPGGDEAEFSEASTISESDTSDASDSEDDCCQKEVVIARNIGDKESFEIHIACFLQEFGRFSGNLQISIDDKGKVMQTEGNSKEPDEWTMCMLLWMKVVKDARMHEDWREQWQESLLSPSQDKLLRMLDKILRQGDVKVKYWDAAKVAVSRCKKKFASVIFLTDEIVRSCLPSVDACRRKWEKQVVRDWSSNTEDSSQILQRMNKFLWSEVESMQIITNVIETRSYICYMSMYKITSLILFQYLETYQKERNAKLMQESGTASTMCSIFHGFCMFASSSGRLFSLQDIDLRRLREIRRNLWTLACLPNRLLLLLGPVRRAQGLLEEDGRSLLSKHQKDKARECEEAITMEKGVHLQGPAGTGKSLVVIHVMLRELEKDRTCSVLFLLLSEDFVYLTARLISWMAKLKLMDDGLFSRILFCIRGDRGWDGPFWMTEGDGELRRKEMMEDPLHEEPSEFKFVVIEQAHCIFCDQEATEYIRTMEFDKATMVLTSDMSQAGTTNISYPQDLQVVELTEFVGNNQWPAPGLGVSSLLDVVEVEVKSAAEGQKKQTETTPCQQRGPTQRKMSFDHETEAALAIKDSTEQYDAEMKGKEKFSLTFSKESSLLETLSSRSSSASPAKITTSSQPSLSLKDEREAWIVLQQENDMLKAKISELEEDLRAARDANARLQEEADRGRHHEPSRTGKLRDAGASREKEQFHDKPRGAKSHSFEKVSGYNSKFSMEGGDEAIYGTVEEYHGGLIQRVGLPSKLEDLRQGMEDEHCNRTDSEEPFTPTNYSNSTTPKTEWQAATVAESRRRFSQGERVIRAWEELMEEERVKTARLRAEEVLALLLYTGTGENSRMIPARLTGGDRQVLRSGGASAGNKYATTIHCIVSGVIKLSKLTKLPPSRVVYRGLKGLRMPERFVQEDELGISGGVEYALLSTTGEVKVAVQYAGQETHPTVFEISCGAIDRGADLAFLSQYPKEHEMLYPPLSYLEVTRRPRLEEVEGQVVQVLPMKINANVTCSTIEETLGKRKQLYVALLENVREEVERDVEAVMRSARAQERLKHSPYDISEGHHKRLQESIVEECRKVVKMREALDGSWYNDDLKYVQAMEEATRLKEMAMSKIYYWLDCTTGDVECERVSKESMEVLYTRTISELHRKARSETGEVAEQQMAAEKACKMQGVWREQGESAVLAAAKKGQADMIAVLVIGGNEVNGRSADGSTALHMAAAQGHIHCLMALLRQHADVDARDNQGQTCAHAASRGGHIEAL
eukprot:764842-Hanusia_phi.AAC.1